MANLQATIVRLPLHSLICLSGQSVTHLFILLFTRVFVCSWILSGIHCSTCPLMHVHALSFIRALTCQGLAESFLRASAHSLFQAYTEHLSIACSLQCKQVDHCSQ